MIISNNYALNLLKKFSYDPENYQLKYIVMRRKNASSKNCDSMAPVSVFIVLEHGFDDFIVKMQLLFQNLLL